MEQDKIWLSTSLFCAKRHWNELLSDGIIPFVESGSLLEAYSIQFNYLCGENIRFSLLATMQNAPQLAKYTDNYFKKYFSGSNFSVREVKLPVKGIFMPFPSNTVQYGLYSPVRITEDEIAEYSLPIKISEIMIEALKDEIIDDETILTFAFYLQIGSIKVIGLTDNVFISYLKTMFNATRVPGLLDINIIISKYEESEETLMEITKDIMGATKDTGLPAWLGKWLETCKNEINADFEKNIDIKFTYEKLTALMARHLGITAEMNSMLLYFIQQTFFKEDIIKSLNEIL